MSLSWSVKLRNLLAGFAQNSEGNITIIFTLALIPLMAAVGAAVDFSRGSSVKTAMQAALDAAALNVVKNTGRLSSSTLTSTASSVFMSNFNRPEAANVQVAAVFDSTNAVLTLTGSATLPTQFMGVMGVRTMNIGAVSKARSTNNSNACVIALDTRASQSFYNDGSGDVVVPNCGIWVNSTANQALAQKGVGSIQAKSISVVGSYGGKNYSPTPKSYQKPIDDPLASIPEPVPSSCHHVNGSFNSIQTFSSGTVFCGDTKFNADINFLSGIYYFKGATVSIASNINILGKNGTMLYFDSTSSWDSRGSGQFQITAPQNGIYKGIALFGSRGANLSTVKLQGNKDYFVNGTIYLPKGRLEMYGSTDLAVSAKSGYVIAQQFYYTGMASFTFDAIADSAVPTGLEFNQVALVQ